MPLLPKFHSRSLRLACLLACTAAPLTLTSPSAFSQEPPAAGAAINHIVIKGNQRIEPQTILSYLDLREGSNFTRADIDQALKSLYATGFFADVNLYPQGNDLVVEVIENPIVNRVAFEGNRKMDDDELEKEIELKPRTIYTRTRVQNDVKRLLDIYRRSGRYSATVEPKVIALDQNRVDLVFEVNEGSVANVRKINFVGNKAFSSSALEKTVRTEESRWYKFLSNDDKYDPDRLLYDQELLRRFYTSRGYADFQVKSAVAELTPTKDAFYVTYTVDEGRPYVFGDVGVQSSIKGDAPDFQNMILTKKAEVYNADQVEDTVEAMTKELGNRGFAFVDIDPQIVRKAEDGTVDLTYNIKQGPRVYVERINITGNMRTLDEVIRREFRLAEGDPYSTSKLARTEQRLNNLGFFEKVKITNEPGTAPDKTVINVDVQEKSTGEITLGAGFSTQDGALADLGIREKNFLGKGQDLRFRVLFAAERQQYDIGFTEPYFMNREVAAGFDLFKTEQDLSREASFDRETSGFNLRAAYAMTETLQHGVNYQLKETRITDIDPNASLFIKGQQGNRINSAVGQNFTYDSRDNKFDPTDGTYIRYAQEAAGLGGSARYLKHDLKTGYYYPLAKLWTLQLSAGFGQIIGVGKDVNIADRFFIGGDDLRGFDNYGIGPRDLATGDALGGNLFYTGSAEMRFPIGLPEDLGFLGVVFVDAGSLWDSDDTGPGIADDSSPRLSVGVGLAWGSPFGPIKINLGKAIVKEDYDDTEIFRFSFGTRF